MVGHAMNESAARSASAAREFDDMQRLVRFGNGHLPEACFLLLRVSDTDAARGWLRDAPVTGAAQADLESRPRRVLQIAFTAGGLRAFGLAEEIIDGFSDEFIVGMSGDDNRSRRLGDIGNNSPSRWDWGADEHLDVLLMLYASSRGLADWIAEIRNDSFESAFEVLKQLDTAKLGPKEPFGFDDGISQPVIDWEDTLSTDLHERLAYTNRVKAGELLLGYVNEYGLYTDRPLLDPASVAGADLLPPAEDKPALRDLGRNGSYLVMRQLAQDVREFWRHLDRAVGGDAELRENLASAMVGRRLDGTPLIAKSGRTPKPGGNDFSYDRDPDGHECPVGAHIRRANPRTGDFPPGVSGIIARLVRTLGFGRRDPYEDLISSTRFHRLLRRGRAYGPALKPEKALHKNARKADRGLHFICLGANILRQFEFVQSAWLANTKFAGLAGESDPLLGNREPLIGAETTDGFTRPRPGAPAERRAGLPQFVTVRGGAYFFMPGLKALRFIATGSNGKRK